ncbi:major facilitator superfamily domain-containing protein [Aspergillus coremiiformis]|uniref:Major facilitator superfamily domain-containing protein n=1 Tax=Aspergillus coremiiformis TaxID=138285 RepID=A0A5N6YTT2_9EURO|nr:major facilitator superfamily domain-containing protein [Aspergillus coremiiformis]
MQPEQQEPSNSANARTGATINHDGLDSAPLSTRSSFSLNNRTASTPATGAQTPDPLLGVKSVDDDYFSKTLPTTIAQVGDRKDEYELEESRGRLADIDGLHNRRPSAIRGHYIADESASPPPTSSQGRPPEIPSRTAEILLVLVCSAGLMLFSFLLGDMQVVQIELKKALGIGNTSLPWLVGAYACSNGVSVVVSGSLLDLTPPRIAIVGAFVWLTVWNIVGAFSLQPSREVLFFIVRAMQGLAIGVLVSGSMSVLGRLYSPGIRKNRVFAAVSATAPLGFSLGGIEGGLLHGNLPWIFGVNAIITGLCAIAAFFSIPPLRPVADVEGAEVPSLRQFDYVGALFAVAGCVCLLFGLTQGSVTKWSVYTCILVALGIVFLICLFVVERYVARPLIPSRLWRTKGFTPLMVAYFIGFGSFFGAWQFYAIQFWLRIQHATPVAVALYIIPNAVVGIIATFIVSRILHLVPGHHIYIVSMFAFTLGPAFFLPQTANTSYWALSFPGVSLVTFGPDLAFAAASVFITSNVPRSYQGSAASLLVTNQNLSAAIMTSIADAIGTKVDPGPDGDIGLTGLRAIWWFALACQLLAALVTVVWVRIPKEEEKEHVT